MKQFFKASLGFLILGGLLWGCYWVIVQIWGQFKLLDPKVSVALLTASTTVIVATLTVALGKYYERKKDIEAHYRQKKTDIYDEFLAEFFKVFHTDTDTELDDENPELVNFLREWQRKMILWGGQEVLAKYILWMSHLKKGTPDAKTMFMMEDFFLEVRKDLGHKNSKLGKGCFIKLMLQNPELFLSEAKKNPNVSLAEIAEIEERSRG